MKTTEFLPARNHERHTEPCHGGSGPWYFKDLLAGLTDKGVIQYIHDDILPPGSSFGCHAHGAQDHSEEWYLCLSGHGTMILDGCEYPFGPGDANVCRGGGSHGLRNDGPEDLRFLVIYARG